MAKVLSGRVDDELAAWAQAYADERGVSRSAVLEAALKGLREDARSGVPDLPKPERVPSASETGTKDWREPTEQELRRARERYPDLPPARLHRLARAEARMADMGLPQLKKASEMTREKSVAAGGPGGGDFAEQTQARAELFAKLRTPESAKRWGKNP